MGVVIVITTTTTATTTVTIIVVAERELEFVGLLRHVHAFLDLQPYVICILYFRTFRTTTTVPYSSTVVVS